jgi:hypothetical protein
MLEPIVALLALASFGLGIAEAQQAKIFPVSTTSPFAPNTSSAVTVSILQNGLDVTASWLPEPGQPVQIAVNGLTAPAINLVCPDGSLNSTSTCPDGTAATSNPIAAGLLRTSAYPGQCTNFNNVALTALASDFQLTGNVLTPTDCGGMAVIVVNPGTAGALTFILPQDSNFNGMPDIWESTHLPTGATSLNPADDLDLGPTATSPLGDGIANFDEYRGFIVSDDACQAGQSSCHVRTDPRVKDTFVRLVNPECLSAGMTNASSLLGGGTVTYPTDGTPLFGQLDKLISGNQVHLLGYSTPNATHLNTISTNDGQWVDNFNSLSIVSGNPSFNISDTTPSTDRQINKNAVYPLTDATTGNAIQKGLRLSECLDTSGTTYGSATPGTPNGPDNAIVYTQRIVKSIQTLVANGGSRKLKYSTFVNGVWSSPVLVGDGTPDANPTGAPGPNTNFLISKIIQYIVAMEIGHAVKLTTTFSTQYGYHYAPFSGDNLDQTITNKIDKSTSGFNTFYIPSIYSNTDLGSFKLKN